MYAGAGRRVVHMVCRNLAFLAYCGPFGKWHVHVLYDVVALFREICAGNYILVVVRESR